MSDNQLKLGKDRNNYLEIYPQHLTKVFEL